MSCSQCFLQSTLTWSHCRIFEKQRNFPDISDYRWSWIDQVLVKQQYQRILLSLWKNCSFTSERHFLKKTTSLQYFTVIHSYFSFLYIASMQLWFSELLSSDKVLSTFIVFDLREFNRFLSRRKWCISIRVLIDIPLVISFDDFHL